MVRVDTVLGDVQVLPVGGTEGVSDEGCSRGCRDHGGSVRIGSCLRNYYRTIHMRRLAARARRGWQRRAEVSAERSPYGQRRASRNERIIEPEALTHILLTGEYR